VGGAGCIGQHFRRARPELPVATGPSSTGAPRPASTTRCWPTSGLSTGTTLKAKMEPGSIAAFGRLVLADPLCSRW